MQNPTLSDILGRYSQVPKRKRLAAALAVACLVVVLYYVFISQDQQTILSNAQQKLQQTESERAEKLAYAANLSLYEARLKELGDKLDASTLR